MCEHLAYSLAPLFYSLMWVADHQGLHKGKAQSMIFLVEMFRHFVKNILRKNVLSKIPLLKLKIT
jgi:hypothetical protein